MSDPDQSKVNHGKRGVSFGEAFRFWAKLGFISFGGPAGQIAIMHRELVDRRRWISEERFLHALNYCMLLPGPEAQQLATYIGWLLHRTRGGIVAGALFVIPSVFILLGLSYLYAAYGHLPAIASALSGIKPVVIAIVVEAVLRIGGRALKSRAHVVIAGVAFIAIYILHVPFPLIVLGAGVIGLIGVRAWPREFVSAAADGKSNSVTESGSTEGDHVLGDSTELLEHTRPSAARSVRILAAGLVLWVLPITAIIIWRGWSSLHVQAYGFFSVAALVTFGGAYAVLAYVTQAAVGNFGWLTQAQAIDGLALAETTPGPLIMVLQFVGFMAGWNHPEGMSPAASGIIGALITTYATFLPSFLFIFLGAPYMESLRGNRTLTGSLACITAAVVGVVLNLAIVFGSAVIWPQGWSGGTRWLALILGGTAFLLLYRFKLNVVWVILIGGLVGLGQALLFG